MAEDVTALFRILFAVITSTIGGILAELLMRYNQSSPHDQSNRESRLEQTSFILSSTSGVHMFPIASLILLLFMSAASYNVSEIIYLLIILILAAVPVSYVLCAFGSLVAFDDDLYTYIEKHFPKYLYATYFILLVFTVGALFG